MLNLFKSKKDKQLSESPLSEQLDPELLLASIADGIVVVDRQRLIRVFNHAAAEITGWKIEDVSGLDINLAIVLLNKEGQVVPDNANPFVNVLRGSDIIRDSDAILKTKSDKRVNISLIVSPIKDKTGSITAAIGIFRDITQEKNQEQQRAEFISTASHEMRTPVAAIEGYLALSLNERVSKIDSKAREYLEKAHSSTQHLGKLFQDLLTAAKTEDGRLTSNPEVVEIGKFIDEAVEAMKFVAEKKGLILEDNTQSDGSDRPENIRPISYVYVDPERIREVINNLFDNAVKYTEEGKVSIGLHTDEKEVVVTITDTGQGIPEEDIPHLFQKFYRVDNSATRQVGGTGLGLFIARKIAELYNGRIWAESELGKGSTFFVALPRLTPDQAQALMQQTQQLRPIAPELAPEPITKSPAETSN